MVALDIHDTACIIALQPCKWKPTYSSFKSLCSSGSIWSSASTLLLIVYKNKILVVADDRKY